MSSSPDERKQRLDALAFELRKLSTETVLFHARIAELLGLNPTDHKSLDVLVRFGPITAGQLAEQTGLTTGAITGIVDRLEKAGFARRTRDPNDRRRVIVEPLPEAMEKITPLFASIYQASLELFSRYSDDELALFHRFVNQLQELTARMPAADASPRGDKR